MSKTIAIPHEFTEKKLDKEVVTKNKWAGSVVIADPLTIPQAKLVEVGSKLPPEIEDLLQELSDAKEKYGEESKEVKKIMRKRFSNFAYDENQLPAILACVEKWELENFPEKVTAENFPASPRGNSHKLIEFIFAAIAAVYYGELEIPNA